VIEAVEQADFNLLKQKKRTREEERTMNHLEQERLEQEASLSCREIKVTTVQLVYHS
jgi:hypothetical protein